MDSLPATLLQRRRRESVKDIAETALGLFLRDGFDATTVEAIAAEAGCSPRTFYRYFGTKEDVIFHELPEVIESLGRLLSTRLGGGESEWSALTESLVEFIARFDAPDQIAAPQRMQLWLHEPALKARYLQYVDQAEQMVLRTLCRHRGTQPDGDDLAQLMAVAAVGAYRVTVATHQSRPNRKLASHLRESLAVLARGLH
jgi:AcrR family transcriptional regulator